MATKREKGIDAALHHIKSLSPKAADDLVNSLHDEVFADIDCLQCANCCKTTSPLFTQQDIGRIAAGLGMTRSTFVQAYLTVDEDGDLVFQRPAPCPFLLKDNRCSIYAFRPEACSAYPHTGGKGQRKILDITRHNAAVCPAVFRILERVASL